MRVKPKRKLSTEKGKNVHISPRKNVFKELSATSFRFSGNQCPSNLEEQKERFLRFGITPQFQFLSGNAEQVFSQQSCPQHNQVKYDYFYEAKGIIDKVKEEFGDGTLYIEEAFGPQITCEEANAYFDDYIAYHGLSQEMTVYWSSNLSSSAKMMWSGPPVSCNRPELRRWSLVIQKTVDNIYVTEQGIKCLADHEIGSHYFRMYNDGLQPWFSERRKFHIRGLNCRTCIATEEGLAAINTVLQANRKYLFMPALLYYVACKAQEMSFKDLFAHLEEYISSKDHRWKICMRVKRCLKDADSKGGSAKDQTYFEGAVEILKNVDNIDFKVLFSGRICLDELPRIRRMARLETIRFPLFLQDLPAYIHMLKMIAFTNGLAVKPEPLRRLRKVKSKPIIGGSSALKSIPTTSTAGSSTSKSNKSEESSSFQFRTLLSKFHDSPVPMRIPDAYEPMSPSMDSGPSTSQASGSSRISSRSSSQSTPRSVACCGGGPLHPTPLPLRPYQRLLDRPTAQIYNFPTITANVNKKSTQVSKA